MRFFLSMSLVMFLGAATDFAQSDGAEKYRVYDAFIAKMFAGNKVTFDTQAPVTTFVISDTTTTSYASSDEKENWDRAKQGLPELTDSLIRIYESKLKPAAKLERRFGPGLRYILVDHAEVDELRNHELDWWTSFYEKYPGSGGFITFSNVAFANNGNRALVYFVHWCGPVCGTGHYIVLGKNGNTWLVVNQAEMWIS